MTDLKNQPPLYSEPSPQIGTNDQNSPIPNPYGPDGSLNSPVSGTYQVTQYQYASGVYQDSNSTLTPKGGEEVDNRNDSSNERSAVVDDKPEWELSSMRIVTFLNIIVLVGLGVLFAVMSTTFSDFVRDHTDTIAVNRLTSMSKLLIAIYPLMFVHVVGCIGLFFVFVPGRDVQHYTNKNPLYITIYRIVSLQFHIVLITLSAIVLQNCFAVRNMGLDDTHTLILRWCLIALISSVVVLTISVLSFGVAIFDSRGSRPVIHCYLAQIVFAVCFAVIVVVIALACSGGGGGSWNFGSTNTAAADDSKKKTAATSTNTAHSAAEPLLQF